MSQNNRLNELREILRKAERHGLNVSDLLKKVDRVDQGAKSDTIKIVLMGAFSDGKTTVIAGLTEKIDANMKIDIEESSDELSVYRLDALGCDFEIVDTPGLFGTKEKEIDGSIKRFSQITRDYISQAHIVMYVTNATTPLKDSHADILRYTLRDLNKLKSAVFVLNKMDDAGYLLTEDEAESFENGKRIKTNTFIERLKTVVDLSKEEESRLNVVCVAADPNGRGLDFWLTPNRKESYLKRSRITTLRDVVKTVAHGVDKDEVRASANNASLKDLVNDAVKSMNGRIVEIDSKLKVLRDDYDELRTKFSIYRRNVVENKKNLSDELRNHQYEIEDAIKRATPEDFNSLVNRYIGDEGARLSRTINDIFSKYAEENKQSFENANIEASFEKMGALTESLFKLTSGFLKGAKVTGETVKAVRNVIASGFKFKPWGAIRLAGKISKGFAIGGLVLDAILWYKKRREEEKFKEAKAQIISGVKEAFSDVENQYLKDDATYFKNFAPQLQETESALACFKEEIDYFAASRRTLREYCEEIQNWVDGANTSSQY